MRLRFILLILLVAGIVYSAVPKPQGSASFLSLDVDMWTSEFSEFCQSVRRVRDEQYDPGRSALNAALDGSACSRVAGEDSLRHAAPPRPPQPVQPPAPVAQPTAPAAQSDAPPLVRDKPVLVNAPAHMRDTCARMNQKLDDPSLSDQQWRDLTQSYVQLCMQ